MAGDRLFHRVRKDRWLRVTRGEGCWLYGDDGRAWLDACAGVHVVSIGHGVPEIAEAMEAQARKVAFTYSRFLTEPQVELADRIAALTPGDLNRVFFVSGGSEATESAMKIARKYHLETGNPGKHKIVSRWQSWHGNTVGALSMSGRSPWRRDYEPYLLDFPHIRPCYPYRCPYCRDECALTCAEDLERVILQEGAETIAAFIAEPILGTSCAGLTPPPDYFRTLREICDRHDVLLIADEVVTGFGRTGLDFGFEHFDVVPDILATGKGLSSGYTPIAATVVSDGIYDAIYERQDHYVHGHTYGGNPLSCAVALAVQDYVAAHDLVDRCRRMGDLMLGRLEPLLDNPIVGAVRGKGLLTGVEFVADKQTREPFPAERGVTAAVVDRVFDKGVLIMPGAPGLVDGVRGDHIAISPPFTVDEDEVETTVRAVTEAVEETARELGAGGNHRSS